MMKFSVPLSFSRESGPVHAAFAVVSGEHTTEVLALSERLRHEAFMSSARKQGFLNGRLASKLALSLLVPTDRLADMEIYNGVMDQPLIRNAFYHGFQVSLSHSGDTAVAVAYPESHPMGVDIERYRPSATAVIAAHISPEERGLLTDLNHPMGHTMIWSVREGVSKLLKTGMVANPLFYQVKMATPLAEGVFELTFVHLFQYKALSFFWEDFVISMVFPKKSVLDTSFLAIKTW